MDARRESRLLRLAVERGLTSWRVVHSITGEEEAAAAAGGSDSRWGPRLAALVRAGHLDEATLEQLADEIATSETTLVEVPWNQGAGATEAADGAGASEGVAAGIDWVAQSLASGGFTSDQDLDALTDWERYEIVSFLGAGGMGRVYKAYDPSLGRHAALKFLRWNDPLQLERFLREARSQAKVVHDNVCKVYEAGRVRGQPYIAMQYIDGITLGEGADLLTLEEKVQVMRDVADAVHAAHRTGLIHRDLKPGNILLERREGGGWRPYVVDFGLAQDQEARALTRTGSLTGTPDYLSPEQAQSRPLDRRSDVYSLGVVLYELLSGDVPLRAASLAESLIKVVGEAPSPLSEHNPQIPRDLDTIVMKCLEKEPQRRYDSARALAEDLDRFLDGEAILARPPTWSYRAGKWVRKNRALAGVIATAAVLTLSLGAWSLRVQWLQSQRAELLQEFSRQVSDVETAMRLASLLPRHDMTTHKEGLEARMGSLRREMERLGKVAQGPGHYALGRGALALHDYEGALEHLERAWELGYRRPEVAAGLGRALGVLYRKALLSIGDDPQLDDQSRQEIQRQYREPALNYLVEAGASQDSYVQAMVAFYGRRYDEALELTRRAAEEVPWLYEARQLEAEIYLELGEKKQYRGEYEAALGDFEEAGRVYAELMETARSDSTLYAAECARRSRVITLLDEMGRLEIRRFQEALAVCDTALEVDTGLAETYTQKAHIYWRWGARLLHRGEDPSAQLQAALEMGEAAISLNPREVFAYRNLGIAYRILAEVEDSRGRDALPLLEKAEANMQHAIDIQPRLASLYQNLGNLLTTRLQIEARRGLDIRPSAQRGIEAFRRSLDLAPDDPLTHHSIASLLLRRADYEREHGLDPTPSLEAGFAHLDRAVELNPNHATLHNATGNMQLTLAVYQLSQGEDPRPALERAVAAYGRALDLRPGYGFAIFNLALARGYEAQYLLRLGEDPGAAVDAGLGHLAAYAAYNANDPELYTEQARLEVLAARWDRRQGRDPSAPLGRAARAVERGLEVNDRWPQLYEQEAMRCQVAALWALDHGEDATGAIRSGRAAADRALEINPEQAETRVTLARLLRMAARLAAGEEERHHLLTAARGELGKALEQNPNLGREHAPLLAELETELQGELKAAPVQGGAAPAPR